MEEEILDFILNLGHFFVGEGLLFHFQYYLLS